MELKRLWCKLRWWIPLAIFALTLLVAYLATRP